MVAPGNDELMVIPPCCAGLSLRPRRHERSSPDAHDPGASAPRLRTWVVLRGFAVAPARSGSGGPGDSLAEQDADRRGYGYQRRHAPGGSLEAAAAGRLRGYLLRDRHAEVPRTACRIRRTSRRDEGLTGTCRPPRGEAAIPGGSRGSSCTPAGRRHALLGDLDCALGRRSCRGRSVPRRRGRSCSSPVPAFSSRIV